MFKKSIAKDLSEILKGQMTFEEIYNILEHPTNENYGEYSFPTFQLAKIYKKSPNLIANSIKGKFDNEYIHKAEVVNGFLNFFLDRQSSSQKIIECFNENTLKNNKLLSAEKIVIDYSSPN
ncbi:hypothetical protein AB1D30_002629, partial [Staphylococcus pseudintermedius]